MASSGLLRRVALVRTDVSEEPCPSFIRVTEIGELETTQAATSNRRTLRRNWYTRRNNPEDTILHSHRRENLKSYKPTSDVISIQYSSRLAYLTGNGQFDMNLIQCIIYNLK
jgi:hypothetical protein